MDNPNEFDELPFSDLGDDDDLTLAEVPSEEIPTLRTRLKKVRVKDEKEELPLTLYAIPENSPLPIETGIPLQVDFTELIEGDKFLGRLQVALWNMGLIEPQDFEEKQVLDKINTALRQALRISAAQILDYVREKYNHG